MVNYLFLFRFFLCFSFLLISYLPFSYAKRERYRNMAFPEGTHIICNKGGVEKLLQMRTAQWKKNGSIERDEDPIPSFKEGCVRTKTNVTFLEVAQEYSFQGKADYWAESPQEGQHPCPWNPDKRCLFFYGPPVQYVRAEYLASDGQWYGNVFIEIPGDIVFVDHPDDVVEEGRTPDALSQNMLQAKFLVTLVEKLNDAFSSIRAGEEHYNDSQIARGEDRVKEPPMQLSEGIPSSNKKGKEAK